MRFKLTIAYDGTHYAGWQWQHSGISVQQRLEEALTKLFPSIQRVHSSSRTDAGVHALGMVAHVDVPDAEFRMTEKRFLLAANAHLPPDIRVMAVSRSHDDFHARFDAKGKQYRYTVWNHPAMNPLLIGRAWHVKPVLDLPAMRAAAALFPGRHDFRSFAATHRNYEVESTVRTLTRCDIKRSGHVLTFIIEGEGFLYKMCRGIVGTLVQVGQGKIGADQIRRILDDKDRRSAGMSAPAHGLILWKVFYK